MKELSIEEKAKRYDEALEEAKKWHKTFVIGQNYPATDIKVSYEWIFPELKESEDEMIRKWCISHFKECINVIKDNDEYKEYLSNKVIAWLERQGRYEDNSSKYINCLKIANKEIGNLVEKNYYLKEKLSEHPIFNGIDKPKFKVGDYIISNNNSEIIYHITGTGINELGSSDYVCEHVGREKEYNGRIYNMPQNKVDANFRLWTIQDAKDGDVLSYNNSRNDV